MKMPSLTPEQYAKCALLGVSVRTYESYLGSSYDKSGYFVSRGEGREFMWTGLLCVVHENIARINWPTKRFLTIDKALKAAADPKRFGLGWDDYA